VAGALIASQYISNKIKQYRERKQAEVAARHEVLPAENVKD
jgi:hypothetical protein